MEPIVWAGTQIGAATIGIILLAFGSKTLIKKSPLSHTQKSWATLAGIAFIAYAVASYFGVSFAADEAPAPVVSVGSFDVTASESMSWLTVDNQGQAVTWAVTYNFTAEDFTGVGGAAGGAGAESNTQYALISFNVDRGLGTVGLVQTYGEVTSVPSISNETTGDSYDLLTKTNEEYNALWTRADDTYAYEMITVTIAETADGAVVTLNMTLSSTAVGSMEQYDVVNLGVVIGGESWNMQVLLANVS